MGNVAFNYEEHRKVKKLRTSVVVVVFTTAMNPRRFVHERKTTNDALGAQKQLKQP